MEAFRAIFAVLDDPRDHNTCHELHEVLFLAFAAVLCGAQNCVEIAEFGRAKLPLLRSFLTLRHGAPSHDTISRLFRLLDPKAFAGCFARFMEAFHAQLVRERGGQRVVAIDGKSLRRAYDKGRSHMPAMMVSAWGVETRLTLASPSSASTRDCTSSCEGQPAGALHFNDKRDADCPHAGRAHPSEHTPMMHNATRMVAVTASTSPHHE